MLVGDEGCEGGGRMLRPPSGEHPLRYVAPPIWKLNEKEDKSQMGRPYRSHKHRCFHGVYVCVFGGT